jgi:hypothetical protein
MSLLNFFRRKLFPSVAHAVVINPVLSVHANVEAALHAADQTIRNHATLMAELRGRRATVLQELTTVNAAINALDMRMLMEVDAVEDVVQALPFHVDLPAFTAVKDKGTQAVFGADQYASQDVSNEPWEAYPL